MKERERTDYIIIHCSATSPSMDWGAEEIDRLHRSKGWLGIGYHFVITRDGTVEPGRPEETIGAHAGAYNKVSLGICLSGGIAQREATSEDSQEAQERGFVALPDTPEENFSEEQYAALRQLLRGYHWKYPEAQIVGHCDVDPDKPHCPGFDVEKFLMMHQIGPKWGRDK